MKWQVIVSYSASTTYTKWWQNVFIPCKIISQLDENTKNADFQMFVLYAVLYTAARCRTESDFFTFQNTVRSEIFHLVLIFKGALNTWKWKCFRWTTPQLVCLDDMLFSPSGRTLPFHCYRCSSALKLHRVISFSLDMTIVKVPHMLKYEK